MGTKLDIKQWKLNKFEKKEFIEPHSFYWPGYMWLWNDKLVKEELIAQLHEMNEVGAKTVWIVPLPKSFRPNSMPTYLEPDYFTPEYFQIYRELAEEMQKLKMTHWFSDEPGWPSGSMGGKVVRENASLGQKYIEKRTIGPVRSAIVEIPENIFSAYIVNDKTYIRRVNPGERVEITEDNLFIEIYALKDCSTSAYETHIYPDILNYRSTQEILRLTYEVYKESIGEYFGNTVMAVFNDEARVINPPWTDDLAEDFKAVKGYDIIDHLPAIFNNDDDDESFKVRIDYFDWWSSRLVKAYFGQIQDWCRNNSLLFIGHVGGEHITLGSRKYGYGHVLRALRCFDIPGTDTIWRQLYPAKERTVEINSNGNIIKIPDSQTDENHHYPKYASSVVHQTGKPWALTESFAIYGSGLTLEYMKWLTDYQYVRGINITAMSCTYSNPGGHFMAGCRPAFTPANPQWDYLILYHSYTARLSYLLSLGRPHIKTAVYFPVRDLWAGGPEVEKIAASNDTLARVLLESQCDFDFIDDDILESDTTKVTNGELDVGPMKYTTICISRSRWMSSKSKERLADFANQGGTVLWVDNKEYSSGPEHCLETDFTVLKDHIVPLIQVQPANKYIRACSRLLDNGKHYFITNEADIEIQCNISFQESLPLYVLNPETGDCWKPKAAAYSEGICTLPVSIPFAGSMMIFFTNENIPVIPEPSNAGIRLLNIEQGWRCRKIKSYRIGEEKIEIEDVKEEPILTTLGDWKDTLGEEFSGNAEYMTIFRCSKDEMEKACLLDLGEVKSNCEVILNGINLGKKSWKPFTYIVKSIVREGMNELKVIVTNTMANQYVTTTMLDKYPENKTGNYTLIEKAFEKQCTASGLLGPVFLRG